VLLVVLDVPLFSAPIFVVLVCQRRIGAGIRSNQEEMFFIGTKKKLKKFWKWIKT
jgi:hypothetical protein